MQGHTHGKVTLSHGLVSDVDIVMVDSVTDNYSNLRGLSIIDGRGVQWYYTANTMSANPIDGVARAQ